MADWVAADEPSFEAEAQEEDNGWQVAARPPRRAPSHGSGHAGAAGAAASSARGPPAGGQGTWAPNTALWIGSIGSQVEPEHLARAMSRCVAQLASSGGWGVALRRRGAHPCVPPALVARECAATARHTRGEAARPGPHLLSAAPPAPHPLLPAAAGAGARCTWRSWCRPARPRPARAATTRSAWGLPAWGGVGQGRSRGRTGGAGAGARRRCKVGWCFGASRSGWGRKESEERGWCGAPRLLASHLFVFASLQPPATPRLLSWHRCSARRLPRLPCLPRLPPLPPQWGIVRFPSPQAAAAAKEALDRQVRLRAGRGLRSSEPAARPPCRRPALAQALPPAAPAWPAKVACLPRRAGVASPCTPLPPCACTISRSCTHSGLRSSQTSRSRSPTMTPGTAAASGDEAAPAAARAQPRHAWVACGLGAALRRRVQQAGLLRRVPRLAADGRRLWRA